MKKEQGFTLIELVVVIVILGILAVTAAPKFMNLQNDARNASLQGLKGAIQGAAGIVYGKAAIKGIEASTADTDYVSGANGTKIDTYLGYPTATKTGIEVAVNGLSGASDKTNSEWKEITADGGIGKGNGISYSFTKGADSRENCYVNYQKSANDGESPIVTVVDCVE